VFEGFEDGFAPTSEGGVFFRHTGSGPTVVLLHGHPRTSSTWYLVAPRLVAAGFHVVCADLRGYGRSVGPPPSADHSAHSKRAAANDIVALLDRLNVERFHLVGHDRGSLVALRLALDHPDRIARLALLDCLPVTEHLARVNAEFATAWWHWFFYAQPDKPERVINADPEAWYPATPEALGAENFAERQLAIRQPSVVRAMLEDYRAGLTVDRRDELADRAAGRNVDPPLLVLWSARDDLEQLYGDPLEIWRTWSDDLRGHPIDSGHHMAEEAPAALAGALVEFFRG